MRGLVIQTIIIAMIIIPCMSDMCCQYSDNLTFCYTDDNMTCPIENTANSTLIDKYNVDSSNMMFYICDNLKMNYPGCLTIANNVINLKHTITGNANCDHSTCGWIIAGCATVCTCDFPVCECCAGCIACLGAYVSQCCSCLLPAQYC